MAQATTRARNIRLTNSAPGIRATLNKVSGGRIAASSRPKSRQALGRTIGCGSPSEAPRCGSRSESTHKAINSPGMPTARKAACQPTSPSGAVGRVGTGHVPAAEHEAADRQAERAADIKAARIDGQSGGSLLLREPVGDHRVSRRGGARPRRLRLRSGRRRASRSWWRSRTRAVIDDQSASPIAITRPRYQLSARRPSGIPNRA